MKASQQPGEPEEISWEGSSRDPLDTVHTAIAEWQEHLKASVKAESSHFE
jgi:hypothetical protein